MNIQRLKEAEKNFLAKYPGGFQHPEFVKLSKKHKIEQHEAFAKESFAKNRFDDPSCILDNMVKLVSRSSMVSMFEKPRLCPKSSVAATRRQHATCLSSRSKIVDISSVRRRAVKPTLSTDQSTLLFGQSLSSKRRFQN